MKNIISTTLTAAASFMVIFFMNCTKPETIPSEPDVPSDTTSQPGSVHPDTVANHLHFHNNVTKVPGEPPKAPSAGNSLKISFKDTLFLTDTLVRPIKFLHTDANENVAGVYLQVFIGGTGGTFYYDVPEEESAANSDTISIILIGFNEEGFDEVPIGKVRIIPHKEDGTPIAEAIKELVILEKQPVDASGNSGACSIITEPDESWYWELTASYVGGIFLLDPSVVTGAGGQDIQGCCINGVSNSGAACVNADPAFKRIIHFPTSYQIKRESFKFNHDGSFSRITMENTVNPVPDKSDFCNNQPFVTDNINAVTYSGNWSVVTGPLVFRNDTQILTFANITSTGSGGFGNRSGYIHQLDCRVNALVLADFGSGEGSSGFTLKAYIRLKDDDVNNRWHNFN